MADAELDTVIRLAAFDHVRRLGEIHDRLTAAEILRQAGAGGLLGLGEEGLGVLLHQAVQRGLLGTVALVVDRGAIGRPMPRTGLPTDGLHALLTSRLWWFTVSDGALRRHHPAWCLPCGALAGVHAARWVEVQVGS